MQQRTLSTSDAIALSLHSVIAVWCSLHSFSLTDMKTLEENKQMLRATKPLLQEQFYEYKCRS
ncbi:hypothetical protein QUA07_19495 [Microcoleus sp. T3_A4]|uniref:hypothetical protein n=1 Tax=Microcoleus sp. T3_A4 TaxID=2818968 RepID=UPI002FD6AB42